MRLDSNVRVLFEILNKQSTNQQQFLPFNKSLLTRILYHHLKHQNTLVIAHYSRKALSLYNNNMFNQLVSLGFTSHVKKFSDDQAIDELKKLFPQEVQKIYKQIKQFREGLKSIKPGLYRQML